jgi:hypothetical protein
MNLNRNKDASKIKRLLNWYNMILNIIWSILNLVPISIFCYTLLDHSYFYIFLTMSILPMFFPKSFFDRIQLGKTTVIYKKLGVALVNKLAQNGVIVNNLIRKKFPEYRAVTYHKSSINKLLVQTYMNEKFHFVMFLFFSLTTLYALSENLWLWAVILSITNLIYNIYPSLLQQYIRIKLKLHAEKRR